VGIHRLLHSSFCFLNINTAMTLQLIRTTRTLEAELWQVCGEACVRGERKMRQVLGAFGLPNLTMLRPVLSWCAFWNIWTVYSFNFPIFFRAATNCGYGGTPVFLFSKLLHLLQMCLLGSLGDIIYIILKCIPHTLLLFDVLRASRGPRTPNWNRNLKSVCCVNYSWRGTGIISDNLCLYFNPVLVFCVVQLAIVKEVRWRNKDRAMLGRPLDWLAHRRMSWLGISYSCCEV
jgi:hypothetical protein